MESYNPHFEVSVGSPDEVKYAKVSKKKEEPETVLGTQTVITKRDNGDPFGVSSYLCGHCGVRGDYTDSESKCHKCGKNLESRLKTARDIHKEETKEIIDTQVMHKCITCGKLYDRPTICCNGEFVKKVGSDSFEGYMCVDCQTVYVKPIRCCSGKMVIGDFYSNPTPDLIEKINSSVLKPVEIAIIQ